MLKLDIMLSFFNSIVVCDIHESGNSCILNILHISRSLILYSRTTLYCD